MTTVSAPLNELTFSVVDLRRAEAWVPRHPAPDIIFGWTLKRSAAIPIEKD